MCPPPLPWVSCHHMVVVAPTRYRPSRSRVRGSTTLTLGVVAVIRGSMGWACYDGGRLWEGKESRLQNENATARGGRVATIVDGNGRGGEGKERTVLFSTGEDPNSYVTCYNPSSNQLRLC
ncbi:hypothetical protein RIF29_13815 [Crotalaria pallida]|uniref:Uncharacterized protein n=1 Tax=Crotalaria pallida TaxID=3830 RepID=A0AAN9IQA5_CROPI